MSGRRFYNNNVPIPTDYILSYDLEDDLFDRSINANNGVVVTNLPTLTTKDGKKCASFNGSQSFRTTSMITVNKTFTLSFKIWSAQTTSAIIAELSANFNSNVGFAVITGNNVTTKRLDIGVNIGGANYNLKSINSITTGAWHHIVGLYDSERSVNVGSGADNEEWFIYKDGIEGSIKTSHTYNNSNFTTTKTLYVGQRAGTSSGFIGFLRKFRIYPRTISNGEILALNKEE